MLRACGASVSTALILLCCAANCTAQGWEVLDIHPWVEATADELRDLPCEAADRLELTGLGNEYLSGALLIRSMRRKTGFFTGSCRRRSCAWPGSSTRRRISG